MVITKTQGWIMGMAGILIGIMTTSGKVSTIFHHDVTLIADTNIKHGANIVTVITVI